MGGLIEGLFDVVVFLSKASGPHKGKSGLQTTIRGVNKVADAMKLAENMNPGFKATRTIIQKNPKR